VKGKVRKASSVLRNTKQYVANAQYWEEKHFNPLTVESHGTHVRNST